MKKILLLTLLAFLASRSYATVTFTLVSNPCDTNKVLVAHFTGTGTPPYQAYWYSGAFSGYPYQTGLTGNTDTLYHYAYGPAQVVIYDATFSIADSGTYAGVAPPFTYTFAPVPPYCGTTATASVTVTGGTPPFTYAWLDYTGTVATGNPATLPSGLYGVLIVDATGCMTGTLGYPIGGGDTLSPTPAFSFSVTSTDANCTNGTAAVVGVPSGAVPPLNYAWSNGATSSSIVGLVTGSYVVTVTDAMGCVASGSAYINQTTVITVSTTATPATCIATNGAIIGFGSGGMPPYSYLWSNGATVQSLTGLTSGSISLTVTDAHGCIGTGWDYITSSTPIVVTYSTTASLCTAPTGSATLAITGGTPPYADTFYTLLPLQTGVTASNLAAGIYSFKVVDAIGCVQSGAVIVPPVDNLNLAFAPTPALCTLSNGSMGVTVTGGVTPYTYLWNTGSTTSAITGQPSGDYSVTVTDANHCAKNKTYYLPFVSPVSVGLSSTPASCLFVHDGTATATGIGGTAPYTYSWSNGGTTATITGLETSYLLNHNAYYVTATDANGCVSYDNYDYVNYNPLDSTCLCVIKGTVYYDMNGNCTQDAGEPGIDNIQVYCSGIGYTYTDASGNYSFIVPSGTYTITQTVLGYYPLAACQSNNISITTTAGIGCQHIVNFADSINPIHDVSISTWDYTHPVPGSVYTQICIISNNGTITEPGILGGYNTDGQVFGASFIPSGIFTPGATNWYSTTGGSGLSLAPGASQQFSINYAVPTFIPISTNLVFKDSVAYTAPMSNWLTDYSPWDNVNYFTTLVIAPYDPNFIQVSPKGTGPGGDITYADSNLQYMVHFQNTGTYQAQNVVVVDTLDPNLDWTTLRPVYESGACKVTLSTSGVAKFTFTDINLPPSSDNPITSNGMFTYTIKTKPGLTVGTQFKAHASIYFDYNAPVVTDTTLNTLWWPDAITPLNSAVNTNSFTIYPNPANQSFNAIINADNAGKAGMIVSDVTGKTLITKSLILQKGQQTITTDASLLAAGMYFVTFNQNGRSQTQKLVIMK